MKEYLQIMKEEQKQLRKMIADCIRYIKKYNTPTYWVGREYVEIHEGTMDTSYSNVSIAEIVDGVDPKDYSTLFVRGSSYKDYDGDECSQVELYSIRKQTDQEYFDSLCSCVLPTEYQSGQYETYLRLKKQFEG